MTNRIALMKSESIQIHHMVAHSQHLTVPSADIVSPSLQSSSPEHGPAHEMKYLLTEDLAQRVADDLRGCLRPDPHGNSGAVEGQYWVTSVYCDTPQFDMYHRREGYAGRKYRLRRYSTEDVVFLERKDKRGSKVRKRRTGLQLSELNRLPLGQSDLIWDGAWFQRQVNNRELSPVLTVMYQRQAFVGTCAEGPLRLTFDRCIRGVPTSDWQIEPFSGGSGILSDRVICEFKFRNAMPAPFKAVVEMRQLSPANVSKYRLCLAASGVISNESGNDV